MRVATFNIHHGTVAKDGPVDPARLGQVCADFDADVLALEEVDVGTWRAKGADLAAAVAVATGMAHVFGASRRFPGGSYGNALFVRGEIRSWSVLALPRVPAWRCWQERRTVLVAEMLPAALGGALRVCATHLAVPQEVNGPQLDHVLDVAVGPRARTGVSVGRPPTVVLGDLNRFPSTVAPAARRAGLVWVDHGPTSPVQPRRRLVIDHVLVTPDLEVTGVEVRATAMSDHAALLVDLAPRPQSGAAAEAAR
ncbi:MAG: endonuclease/exonuclease/phosphatase family protein [Acidimicrobiales bacterium]